MTDNPKQNVQDTIKVLKELKSQLEKLATARVEEASQELAKYITTLEAEKRRRS